MSYCPSLPFWELYVACALAGCSTNTLEPDSLPPPAQVAGSVAGDTLTAVADAHLRSAAKNLNSGTSQTIPVKITVGEADTTRAIVKFDQAAIVAALGSRTLTGATLELPVKEAGTGPAGNDIDVHRVLKPWTEAGVTWKCGEDLNTANVGADCPTTKWKMDGADMDAFVATRTARAHLSSGQTGTASFDVTTDVQAFLAGQGNHGWLVNAGSASSRALLWSREAALKPRLLLAVGASDTTRPAVPTADSWPTNPRLLPSPGNPGDVFYADLVRIRFDDSTSGSTIRGILARHNAVIFGGSPEPVGFGYYFLQIAGLDGTWSALDSVMNSLGSEPGVRRVVRLSHRLRLDVRGRYPEDGRFSTRADWLRSPAPVGTQPRLAIRAPLAWGCETGTYTAHRQRVAVLDLTFDENHPDFDANNTELKDLSADVVLEPNIYLTIPDSGAEANRAHGTGVAGILAAVGDNGRGIAGMLWSADLNLYNYGRGTSTTNAMELRFEETLRAVASADTRLLVTSIGLGDVTDSNTVGAIREAIQFYLSNPRNLFVIATGNDTIRESIALVAAGSVPGTTALDRALAQLYPTLGDQIIFVAGTDRSGALWDDSNVWLGATFLAAPADFMLTLGLPSEPVPGFDPGTRVVEGTSFSAPFVAGTAAQLWLMEPSLTARDVKGYLVRGAQSARVDPVSANLTPPSPVAVAFSTLYQLDAYGSLSLLSRERTGTPICGFPVTLELPQSGPRVRLARNGSNSETIAVNRISGYQVDGLSVAQGGRLFAVGQVNFEPNTPPTPMEVSEYALANGQWSVRRTIPDIAVRTYLEKDTVDSDNFSGFFGTRWTLRGPRWGSGTTLRLAETTQPYLTPTTTPFYPFTYPYTYGVEFSPDGAFAVVRTRLESPPCPNYQDQMWLVTLPNGPVQALLPTQCDGEGPRDAAWDPSSSRFILAEIGSNGATYQARKIVGGVAQADGPGVTVPDRFPTDYSLGAEGHSTDPTGTTATWLELVQNGCYLTTRTTSTFALVSEQLYPYSNSDWLGFCQVPVQMLRTKPGSVTLRH